MCCGIPPDLYEVVVLGNGGPAFAAVFAARERGRKVGLVLPETPLTPQLLQLLAAFELTVITGCARPDPEDAHYLDIDGRLIYGAQVIDTVDTHRTADEALEALGKVNLSEHCG